MSAEKIIPNEETKSCMMLETATYIFAIFNLTLSTAATLASTGAMTYFFGLLFYRMANSYTDYLLWYFCGFVVLLAAASSIALVFAVYLFKGIHKKNSIHIRAYFNYGVVTCVMSAAGAVAWVIFSEGEDYLVTVIILIVCFAYALVLLMIHKTYKKLESSPVYQFRHKLLVET